MLNKLKNIKITKRGIYISLAICMILVGTIGIYASVKNMNKIITEADLDINNLGEINDTVINTDYFKDFNKEEKDEPVITETKEIALEFILPVNGSLSKDYSGDELVYSITMNDYRTHTGVDVYSDIGTPVYSCEEGKIINISDDPLWGNTVTIEHQGGYISCYKNLSEEIPEGIEVGAYVAKGGVIGTVGSTAIVEIGEEPHIHFEMTFNGNTADPCDYIQFN